MDKNVQAHLTYIPRSSASTSGGVKICYGLVIPNWLDYYALRSSLVMLNMHAMISGLFSMH